MRRRAFHANAGAAVVSWLGLVFWLGTAAAASGQTLEGAARWADSARMMIDAASVRGDTAMLNGARVLLERALTAHPDDALLLHYAGFAAYREASLLQGRYRAAARDALERAESALSRSAEQMPMPETWALLASVLGMRIGSNPLRGMTLGPRSGSLMERALAAGRENPRVALLRGMSHLFTPSMFGGGLDRAEAELERAIELFAEDAPQPPLPAWGHADAWLWLGQVYQRKGDRAKARDAYVRALEIEPENDWVREVLLPAVTTES